MTNETEEQMQVWFQFTWVSTFIPTQTHMHITCVLWIAGILCGVPSCGLWEDGHCLLGCCWMDGPCPLSCGECLLSRAAELASPSCLSQSLIILNSQSQMKVWLTGRIWRKCWFGLESNTWAHLQITSWCLTEFHRKVRSGVSVGDMSHMWGKLRNSSTQLQLEELGAYEFDPQ